MKVTEVIVKKPQNADRRILANVCVVMNEVLKLNGLRLIQGNHGPFLTYPGESHKIRGKMLHFHHIYPVTTELRTEITAAVVATARAEGLLPEEAKV